MCDVHDMLILSEFKTFGNLICLHDQKYNYNFQFLSSDTLLKHLFDFRLRFLLLNLGGIKIIISLLDPRTKSMSFFMYVTILIKLRLVSIRRRLQAPRL